MDKISGIIPSSPRLQAVDLKDSPVRPGTPSFGRPQGVSSLAQNNIPSFETTTPMRAAGVQKEMLSWRDKDQLHASMAAELSNRFFMKREPVQETTVDVTNGSGAYAAGLPIGFRPVESSPAGFKSNEIVPYNDVMDEGEEDSVELQQPEGLYPKGSFLDKTV